uniref:Uncharacterized protein n=1 Tax=Parastrongyloides trichosuri TaxID=131310 RepID=A0A0N4Z522_PARTI
MKLLYILSSFISLFQAWNIDDYLTDCWGNKCRDDEGFLQRMPFDPLDVNKFVLLGFKTLENRLIVSGPVIPYGEDNFCMLYVDEEQTFRNCKQIRVFNQNSFDKGNCIFSQNIEEPGLKLELRNGRVPIQYFGDDYIYYGYFDTVTNFAYFPNPLTFEGHIVPLVDIERYLYYLHCRND